MCRWGKSRGCVAREYCSGVSLEYVAGECFSGVLRTSEASIASAASSVAPMSAASPSDVSRTCTGVGVEGGVRRGVEGGVRSGEDGSTGVGCGGVRGGEDGGVNGEPGVTHVRQPVLSKVRLRPVRKRDDDGIEAERRLGGRAPEPRG